MNHDWCSFTSVNTNETHPLFHPSYDDPTVVHRIDFKSSKMPILTDELCKAFPNLRDFYVVGTNLERITKGALDKCSNLILFDIYGNFVIELDINLFVNNPEMRHIKLSANRLKYVDVRIFEHCRKLEFLYLELNFLVEFDFKNMVKMFGMKEIHLNRNYILAVDENEIVDKFSSLQRIYIEDNLFKCDNLQRMITVFKGNDIQLGYLNVSREKLHNTRKIEGIECLDRKEYLKVVLDKIRGLKVTNSSINEFLFGIIESELEIKMMNDGVVIVIVQLLTAVFIIICTIMTGYHGYYWNKTFEQIIDGDKGDYYYYYQPRVPRTAAQN